MALITSCKRFGIATGRCHGRSQARVRFAKGSLTKGGQNILAYGCDQKTIHPFWWTDLPAINKKNAESQEARARAVRISIIDGCVRPSAKTNHKATKICFGGYGKIRPSAKIFIHKSECGCRLTCFHRFGSIFATHKLSYDHACG